jgi:hypothetical protein
MYFLKVKGKSAQMGREMPAIGRGHPPPPLGGAGEPISDPIADLTDFMIKISARFVFSSEIPIDLADGRIFAFSLSQ